jgi:hypothetical protein
MEGGVGGGEEMNITGRINEHKKKNKVAIVPLGDTVAHDDFNERCWCKPTLEADGHIIIHNSFDGREDFEEIDNTQ